MHQAITVFAKTAATLAALTIAAPQVMAAKPAPKADWFMAEQGNLCGAAWPLANGGRVMINMTKWGDMSDSITFWQPGLVPLASNEEAGLSSGQSEAQDEADDEKEFYLAVTLNPGRPLKQVGLGHWMLADYLGNKGATYRYGIGQDEFLMKLKTSKSLTLSRKGKALVTVPLPAPAKMVTFFKACIDKPDEG